MHTNGSVKQLRRTRNGKIIAGVCSGVGEYIGVDPNILRLAFAVATFFGGLGAGVYAVAWLLLPEDGKPTSIAQDLINNNKDGHVWQDAKARWDHAQSTWKRPADPAPYGRQPAGYESHPYGQAPASTPTPAPTPTPDNGPEVKPEDKPQA